MDEKIYKEEEHIVASIDVLGATELIKKGKGLQEIHSVYDTIINDINQYNYYKLKGTSTIEVKIFSDNIVVFCNIEKKDIGLKRYMMYWVIFITSCIQEAFLDENILIRGGITIGDFFCDEVMVWGNALIRAYKLESEIALYPRIIIDKCILDSKLISFNFKELMLLIDADGCYFVNFFNVISLKMTIIEGKFTLLKNEDPQIIEEIINEIKSSLEKTNKKIEENQNNYKVLQKLNWHKNYLNMANCMIEHYDLLEYYKNKTTEKNNEKNEK